MFQLEENEELNDPPKLLPSFQSVFWLVVFLVNSSQGENGKPTLVTLISFGPAVMVSSCTKQNAAKARAAAINSSSRFHFRNLDSTTKKLLARYHGW